MVRTPCCDQNGLKKGTWTPEEDRKLIAYVTRYGCWNWRQLPRFAGLQRCGKSCRLRWMNYLRPNIKRGNYTREEEETIIRLHNSLGNRWSAIAAQLPGRTDNEIKNHWHTNLKKRVQHNKEEESDNSTTNHNLLTQAKINNNNNNHNNNGPDQYQAALQVLESSMMSSQTCSSSDEASTTSADSSTETSGNYLAADDPNFGTDSLETLSEFSGNFWTEPFLADDSYMPSESITPMIDLEFFPPVFDGSRLSFAYEYYLEHESCIDIYTSM